MNLPYTITIEELINVFSKYGTVQDVELPLRRGATPTGYAFIRFETVEAAISAFAAMDKQYF